MSHTLNGRTASLLPTALLSLALASSSSAQLAHQPRMGEPLPGLSAAQLARFELGKAEFDLILSEADGLGPIFNDTSCSQCHSNPAIGGFGTTKVTRFGKAANGPNPFDPLDSLGGTLLQKSFLFGADPACEEIVPPEADVEISRTTPHTFGSGLLESLNDNDIRFFALNPQHPDLNGFTRNTNPVEGGPSRFAKFGWKGPVATVFTFSADASLNEMGLTSSFFPDENAPNGNAGVLVLCDTVADPEDVPDIGTGDTRIARQADFQRFLAPPPQTPKSGMTGEQVFNNVGCQHCHVQSFTTDFVAEAVLSNVPIQPYSDFLLHDMGATLGDGIVDGPATETMMFTRALWGAGQKEEFMHDGRSTGGSFEQNVDAAVLEHAGGEAQFAVDAYNLLSPLEKDQLAAFIASLGRPEFDIEYDNKVDVFDFFFLEPHLNGPDPLTRHTPDDDGALADVDQDGDFDMVDAMVFQRAFTGQ